MRTLFATLLLLTLGVSAQAQTVTVLSPVPPSTMLAFDHDGTGTDGYAIWVDGTRSAVTTALVGLAERRTAFPALTPGVHTIEATAYVIVDGVPIDSPKSETLTVRIVVVPAAPGRPRTVTVTVLGVPSNNGLRLTGVEHDLRDAAKNGHAGIH